MAPFLDLRLGHVLDGHLESVPAPHPGVDDPESPLAENWPNLEERKLKSKHHGLEGPINSLEFEIDIEIPFATYKTRGIRNSALLSKA